MHRETNHRPRNNATGIRENMRRAAKPQPVPPGVTFDDVEAELWAAYCKVRTPDNWRAADLVHLARVVKHTIRIDRIQAKVDEEGETVDGSHGPRIHPRLTAMRQYGIERDRMLKLLGILTAPADRSEKIMESKKAADLEHLNGLMKDQDNSVLLPLN